MFPDSTKVTFGLVGFAFCRGSADFLSAVAQSDF